MAPIYAATSILLSMSNVTYGAEDRETAIVWQTELLDLEPSPARHPASRRMRAAVESAQASRETDDWLAVGTANMEFHSAIVGLADSDHLDRLYANISAELRLAFGLLDDPDYLHRPYVDRNAAVLERYLAGDSAGAASILEDYLLQSERTIVAAYARQVPA